jgi:hypothetical protein
MKLKGMRGNGEDGTKVNCRSTPLFARLKQYDCFWKESSGRIVIGLDDVGIWVGSHHVIGSKYLSLLHTFQYI